MAARWIREETFPLLTAEELERLGDDLDSWSREDGARLLHDVKHLQAENERLQATIQVWRAESDREPRRFEPALARQRKTGTNP